MPTTQTCSGEPLCFLFEYFWRACPKTKFDQMLSSKLAKFRPILSNVAGGIFSFENLEFVRGARRETGAEKSNWWSHNFRRHLRRCHGDSNFRSSHFGQSSCSFLKGKTTAGRN